MYCATDPELAEVSGRYYHLCRDVPPSVVALDTELAAKLYAWSERAVERRLA